MGTNLPNIEEGAMFALVYFLGETRYRSFRLRFRLRLGREI